MTFARLLSEAIASDGLPRTGDVLAVATPLLDQLAALHDDGLVAGLASVDDVVYDGTALRLLDPTGREPQRRDDLIRDLNPEPGASAIEVWARHKVDMVVGERSDWTSGDVHDGPAPSVRPMLLVGYRAWERDHGHHDPLTDIAVAGLMVVSFATGLDLDNERDVHLLANHRRHLTTLNPGLHPVVANVLAEMIDPDRHRRPPEVSQVITRLEHHRELPEDLDLVPAYADPDDWRRGVLSTLRDRVFDTTRRNRALYFRPSATTVSLTEASVPLLLDVNRVDADDLFTWTSSVARKLQAGSVVDLEQWCRFEEAPHVAPALDKLISNERKLRTESGHGRLRLIVAFLRWWDPRNDEVVHSPLLVMAVELRRRKGVKKRYELQIEGDAQVNPILRFVFEDRFGIALPESVGADVESIRAFTTDLERQVKATAPSVEIALIEKPRIELLRRRAQLRVDNYRRRRARTRAATGRWRRTSHSYSSDDWRPLGLALYRRFVESPELPLRALAGAPARPRRPDIGSSAFIDGDAGAGSGTRDKETYSVTTADVHEHRWEVDLCAVTLAMLGSRRTSLSRDYDDLIARAEAGERFDGAPFSELFAPKPSDGTVDGVAPISIDQRLVLPADDAQARAVRRAVRGDSFIIQGPPGTGKSQTITNLIAALVAEGKRVLFVCEKRAALDVVDNRLRQVGLGDVVATIHDSQLDRKAFVQELGATYRAWLEAEAPGTAADRRVELVTRMNEQLRPLDHLMRDLVRPRLGAHSVRDLVERSVLMRASSVAPVDTEAPDVTLDAWFAARPTLDATREALRSSGLAPEIGRHACLHLAPAVAAQPDPISTASRLGADLRRVIDALRARWVGSTPIDDLGVGELATLTEFASVVAGVSASPCAGALVAGSTAHDELRRVVDDLAAWRSAVEASPVPARWREMPGADDARNGSAVAREQENSFFKFLNGAWRRTKAMVESGYDFSQHQIAPPVSSVLAELVEYHELEAGRQAALAHARHHYGDVPAERVLDAVGRHGTNRVFRSLLGRRFGTPDVDDLVTEVTSLAALADRLVVGEAISIGELDRLAAELQSTSVAHEAALVAWARDGVEPAIASWVLETDADLAAMELRLVDDAAAGLVADAGGSLRGGAELDGIIAGLLTSYRELLELNAAVVAESVRSRFVANVEHSEASMAGRSDEDKARKKTYNAGRRLLEREFSKKMRFRSIRELADGDSGAVVRDLRPVWLMSPLSVSDTLPLDADMFDVVVFDEASQIPVEDAVPSTFRSTQVIVVGDRMQLPPTRFFSAASDGDDELDLASDEGTVTIALDADSFLTQADQALTSSMLTWHYRSRSEALIAYSNHAFYEGALATIPDRVRPGGTRAPIEVEASDDATTTIEALLERPISFHQVRHGVYRNRANAEEADYLAELVRELLARDSGLTIGVVAFSEAQQTAIESALDELATLDDEFALRLDAERNRIDDGEYVGLFVKNLENVQGDERDIILLSVCYAPGEDGRMRMNFGPINQAGGERRLNVIFSRAKRHMGVVSTITGDQITNTHNDGAAHLANFLDYAAWESVGAAERSDALLRTQLGGRTAPTDPGRSAIADSIASALRARGHHVDVGVGRSAFTIDVALRRDDRYVLGIVIDPDEDADATARFVAEAGVLDAFGWPVMRATPTEWWSTPQRVLDRVEHRLGGSGDLAPPAAAPSVRDGAVDS